MGRFSIQKLTSHAIFIAALFTFVPGSNLFADIGALEGVVVEPGRCGDGIKGPGEDCDAGDAGNSLAPDAACRPGCKLPGCWDGILDSGEGCIPGGTSCGGGGGADPEPMPTTSGTPSGIPFCSYNTCECITCTTESISACEDFEVTVSGDATKIDLVGDVKGCGTGSVHQAFLNDAIKKGWKTEELESLCKGQDVAQVLKFTNASDITIPISVSIPSEAGAFSVQVEAARAGINVEGSGTSWTVNIAANALEYAPKTVVKSTEVKTGCTATTYAINHGFYQCATYEATLGAEATENIQVFIKTECCEKTITIPLTFSGTAEASNITHVGGKSPIAVNLTANSVQEITPTLASFPLGSKASRYVLWYGSENTGLLVYDPEKTGKIISEDQLIGTRTRGKDHTDGFAALSTFDENKDGVLRGKELKDIRVWFDLGRDAKSSPQEVSDLSMRGITEINTKSTNSYTIPLHEIRILENAKGVTLKNGEQGLVFDWFLPEIDSKEKWAKSIEEYRSGGYFVFEEEEFPAWELNKNQISGYYVFKVVQNNELKGFYVSANYNLSDSGKMKEYTLLSEPVTGNIDANGKATFAHEDAAGSSLVTRHTIVVDDFLSKAKTEEKLYGKKSIVVEDKGKVIESFKRDSILRKDVRVSELAQ